MNVIDAHVHQPLARPLDRGPVRRRSGQSRPDDVNEMIEDLHDARLIQAFSADLRDHRGVYFFLSEYKGRDQENHKSALEHFTPPAPGPHHRTSRTTQSLSPDSAW